jgi:hypothetical protein
MLLAIAGMASSASLAFGLLFASSKLSSATTGLAADSSSGVVTIDSLKKSIASAASVGTAPGDTEWKSHNANQMGDKKPSSITIVGDVIKRYDDIPGGTYEWNSDFVKKLRAECHANPACTHIEYDFVAKKAWLKNANKVPDACVLMKERCADGDWKRGTRFSEFHPNRGWRDIAAAKWNMLREIDCSSGSSCRLAKIMKPINWVFFAMNFIPFVGSIGEFLSFGSSLLGKVVVTTIAGASKLTPIAKLAQTAGDISTAIEIGTIVSNARKKAAFPYDNRPVISVDDWWMGKKPDS